MADRSSAFDPIAMLTTLDRHRVNYIVIGALARVIHGTDEVTDGLDIVPSLRAENLLRLRAAIEELGADPSLIEPTPEFATLKTSVGQLVVIPQPDGTRGYDDLRRATTREPLGAGVRPAVASVGDLARMLAARGRDRDFDNLRGLRRIAELEAGRAIEM